MSTPQSPDGQFPSLIEALGRPSKWGWFPGYPLCASCGDKPCVCCPECGEVFWPYLCGHGLIEETPAEVLDPAVMDAIRVLTERGIDGAKYEALLALHEGGAA